MKRLQRVVLLLIAVAYSTAWANNGVASGAATIAIASGSVYGLNQVASSSFRYQDMDDWQKPSLGLAIDLDQKCNVNVETSLYNSSRKNVMVFVIQNDNSHDIEIDHSGIKVLFDQTIERSAIFGATTNKTIKIEGGKTQSVYVPFPAKSDFKDKKSILITLPFNSKGKKCKVTASFSNQPGDDSPSTYISAASFEFFFDAGGLIGKTGDAVQLYDGGEVMYNFGVNFFHDPSHGAYFDIASTRMNGELELIAADLEDGADATVTKTIFDIGYTYRGFCSDRISYRASVGLAIAGVYDRSDSDAGRDDLTTQTGLDLKYFVHYQMGKTTTVHSIYDWGFGAGVNARKWLSGEVANQSIKGTDLGFLFRMYLGY